ncbi:MAG: YeiH family protein [Pseudomonadota bacterium]
MRSSVGRPSTPLGADLPKSQRSLVYKFERFGPGIMLAGTVALAASFVSEHLGGPVMLYALLIGIAFNFLSSDTNCSPGVEFSAKTILRVGVALLGVRITFGEAVALGLPTVSLVLTGVAFTLITGWLVGRSFGLRTDHALLSAGAVAICGASAALAISAVLPRHKTADKQAIMTVVGVTALSTLAMVVYPVIAQTIGLGDEAAGIFIGATIHDVAQVVGAGYMISDQAGETAAIVKLMRVACLVPVVMILGVMFYRQEKSGKPSSVVKHTFPGFLLVFVTLMVANSLGAIPANLAEAGGELSRWSLIVAISALGIKTSLRDVFCVGFTPKAVMTLQTRCLAAFIVGGLPFIPSRSCCSPKLGGYACWGCALQHRFFTLNHVDAVLLCFYAAFLAITVSHLSPAALKARVSVRKNDQNSLMPYVALHKIAPI